MNLPYLKAMTGVAALAVACLATSARADAIDGHWCRADGKRMSIAGPQITTPGGNQIQGNYTRHAFSYVVPTGESGAGETVQIMLLNEFLAHARQGSDTAALQEWRRCSATVS